MFNDKKKSTENSKTIFKNLALEEIEKFYFTDSSGSGI